MEFGVLGPLEFRGADGRRGTVGGPRVRTVLALLLLRAGRPVPAAALIDALYGEQRLPGDPANALQSQVSRLRRELRVQLGPEAEALVEHRPGGYLLAVAAEDVDAHRFARLAADGRRALAAGENAAAAELLSTGLALWRGPALADVPAASTEAASLDEQRSTAEEDLAEARLGLGRHHEALEAAQRLVSAHPLRERPRVLLLRALDAVGRRADALAGYQDFRRILAEELGTDPSPELAAAHLAVLRGRPCGAPPPGSTDRPARLTSPPAQLSSFVGREGELRRVRTLLAAHRLVTVLGSGGAGKTRLAVEAAARQTGEVCFVDLAPLGDGTEVPQALLGALGLREHRLRSGAPPPADPVARLIDALSDRPPLLVLDNCEHVVESAAGLAHRLLTSCTDLRILATSREPLGVTGETLHPLAPLACPEPGAPLREAAAYPAVRLFTDRAAAVRPGFRVDARTLPDVVRVCSALDGIPLAIELAAARLRTLPLDQVADRLTTRLDDRFRLLSRGNRTAAPRHRTLRRVVEWSWELLSPEERTLARRLTVFAGGTTADAVTAVCAADGARPTGERPDRPGSERPAGPDGGAPGRLDPADVDDLLASLVEKSLLEQADGRYRMLDTIRAFCAERLAEAGETARFEQAHAAYFLQRARAADARLFTAEQVDRLAELSAEHADLQAALRRTVPSDPALALRLTASLSAYWWLRGVRGEAVPLTADLLRRIGPDAARIAAELPEEYVLCTVHATAGGSTAPDLREHLARAERLMAGYRLTPRHPFTHVLWALTSGPPAGDVPPSVRERIGTDPWSRSLVPLSQGFMHVFRGELQAAGPMLEEALAGFSAVGDRWGIGQTLDAMGNLARLRGETASALTHVDRALVVFAELGATEDTTDLLCTRASVLIADGRLDEAEAEYDRAVELARRSGTPITVAAARLGLAQVARLRGDLDEARRRYQRCRLETDTASYAASDLQAGLRIGLGWLALAEHRPADARPLLRAAFAAATGHPVNLPVAAEALAGLAGSALADGTPERAALLLGAAEALRGAPLTASPDAARVAAEARGLLAPGDWAEAHRRGRSLPRARILALGAAEPPADGMNGRPGAG